MNLPVGEASKWSNSYWSLYQWIFKYCYNPLSHGVAQNRVYFLDIALQTTESSFTLIKHFTGLSRPWSGVWGVGCQTTEWFVIWCRHGQAVLGTGNSASDSKGFCFSCIYHYAYVKENFNTSIHRNSQWKYNWRHKQGKTYRCWITIRFFDNTI